MRAAAFVLLLGCAIAFAPAAAGAEEVSFDRYFVDHTMRVDLVHVGNASEELFTLDRVYEQGIWAGSRTHLLDTIGTGAYLAKLLDAATGTLLYSRGFDSYFGEYRTTAAAGKGVRRAYQESVLTPFPRAKARLVIEHRARDHSVREVFAVDIDPADYAIVREPLAEGAIVVEALSGGDPHRCVDVAVIGEGYTAAEEGKFRSDLRRVVDTLFAQQPFARNRARFNVRGVLKPSLESGCSEPSRGIHRSTAVGASFDALGEERYLLTEDNRDLRDIAAHVPYDALYIMVNHARYGGGGIYNLFCTFTVDNQWSPYVMVHEFGHAFAGLADEYYTSSVAYNDFYPRGVEPAEPNITALLHPADLKWKDLVTPGTPIPTPWEKAGFDAIDIANQKQRRELNDKIAAAMRAGAPQAEVDALKAQAEALSLEHARALDAYLAKSAFVGKVGAFEGAGYSATGLYRPALDCIMFTKGAKPFCAVCERAIQRVIDSYGE
jgi:hypothetical protein